MANTDLLEEWDAAYRAFTAAFDTPLARRKDASDYAEDARTRLRDVDEKLRKQLSNS